MGHEASTVSCSQPHPVLLRLRRTALGPEPAEDRRSAVPRLPCHRKPATGTRRRARTHGCRRFGIRYRTDRGAGESGNAVDLDTDGCQPLACPVRSRCGTDAAGTASPLRRPNEEGHALQAARPRRRPLLAARRRTRARASRDAIGFFSGCSVPLCALYGHATAIGIQSAQRHGAHGEWPSAPAMPRMTGLRR